MPVMFRNAILNMLHITEIRKFYSPTPFPFFHQPLICHKKGMTMTKNLLLGLLFFAFACKSTSTQTPEDHKYNENPIVEIITSKGTIQAELFEDKVPNTVANFISLTEKGFYKDMTFHRILRGFMAQGGCPNSKPGATGRPGTGGPGYSIDEEYDPSLKHGPGMLTMARSRRPGTTGSQFCIFFTEAPGLDNQYTVFGKVISGMDVVAKLEEVGSSRDPVPPSEKILFSVKVISKNNHDYKVTPNNQ
jgi:peptidyl-prolyl cis-trans isomerase B (cyclophilin B)